MIYRAACRPFVQKTAGGTYEQIVKTVEISTATISRINRCIQYGSGGYRDTIEKVQKSAKPE